MFETSAQKGFRITFENGWTASVQFGPGNYCGNHHINREPGEDFNTFYDKAWKSNTAEVAGIPPNRDNEWFQFGGDTVKGWLSPAEVLEFLNTLAAL